MSNDVAIKIQNLSKKYRLQHAVTSEDGKQTHELWALKDINLEIKKGDSLGIIGPNGSGKSTLLKILAGVTKPTSGTVEMDGKVASILDIGAGFHPELTGRENVLLNGQLIGFSRKEIKAKFDQIVDFSGIEKFIDEPVKNYSNGMYLRLAFSIVACLDADIYLFDEVLSVGDAEFRIKCNEEINRKISQSKAVIIVSHDHETLAHMVKEVVELPSLKKVNTFNESTKVPDYVDSIDIRNIQYESSETKHLFKADLLFPGTLDPVDIVFMIRDVSNIYKRFAVSTINASSFEKKLTQGSHAYMFKASVSKAILSPGEYSVDLLIIHQKNIVAKKITGCLQFAVNYDDLADTLYNNPFLRASWLTADWELTNI